MHWFGKQQAVPLDKAVRVSPDNVNPKKLIHAHFILNTTSQTQEKTADKLKQRAIMSATTLSRSAQSAAKKPLVSV
jgi:hypothetical protein